MKHTELVAMLERTSALLHGYAHEFSSPRFTDRYGDGPRCKLQADRIDAALTALKSGAVVLVPGEPTEEMMQAGNDTGCFERDYPLDSRTEAATVYRAMLACAKGKP